MLSQSIALLLSSVPLTSQGFQTCYVILLLPSRFPEDDAGNLTGAERHVISKADKVAEGTYIAPSGGERVTSTIKVNGQTVNLGIGQFYKGQIIVDGITIEYTSYGVSEGIINIGTYYPLK